MKRWGKNRQIWVKLIFFRYSVGESSMIVGLFFFRPIVKILIYLFKRWLLVTGLIPRDPGFLEIIGKFPRNFRSPLGYPHTPRPHTLPSYPPPYPYPLSIVSNPFFSILYFSSDSTVHIRVLNPSMYGGFLLIMYFLGHNLWLTRLKDFCRSVLRCSTGRSA